MGNKRNLLIALRESKGLTQEKVAEKAGISRTYYVNIEQGKRNPRLEHMKAICRALGVDETLNLF